MRIIGGKFRSQKILVPKSTIRPTSSLLRECFFNICQGEIEGCFFLDLFAGTGAMGLEALSRGAKFVTFVEKDKNAFHSITKNIHNFGMEKSSEALRADVIKAISYLERISRKYSFIYIDPPYKLAEDISYIVSLLEKIVKSEILEENGSIYLEKGKGKEDACSDIIVEHLVQKGIRKVGDSQLIHFSFLKKPLSR